MTPTFTPTPGTFTSPQSVTIATTTAGADIFFTTDGTNPTPASPVFSSPIAVSQSRTIRAIAVAKGFTQSGVGVGAYTINIPAGTTVAPSPTPVGGTYDNTQSVGLSTTTAGATICYTVDGITAPTCTAGVCQGASATYSGASPISVTTSGTKIKALACKAGNLDGVMPDQTYAFKVAAPLGTPPSGTVAYGANIGVSTKTTGATIRILADGNDPTCVTGAVYDPATFATIAGNASFKAIACRTGFADSNVSTISWTVLAGAPKTTPAAGLYNDDQTVNLSPGGAAPDADVFCYTTNGTDPACTPAGCTAGAAGTGPIPVTKDNSTIRVVGCKAGGLNVAANQSSPITSSTYQLKVGTISENGRAVDNFIATDPEATTVNVTLDSLATTDETICYTTNNTTPTCSTVAGPPRAIQCGVGSSLYGGTINALALPVTVKAIACKLDYQTSDPRSVTFADPASTVGINVAPGGGTYSNDQTIGITAAPADATICYQLGNVALPDPVCNQLTGLCTTGTTYNPAAQPTVTSAGTRLKVTACKVGIMSSAAVQSFDYVLQAGTPNVDLSSGTYAYGAVAHFGTITLGADLHYTTALGAGNAAAPSCASPVLAGGTYTINQGGTTSINVVACKAGYQISTARSLDYTLDTNLAAPVLSVPAGTYTNTQTVNVSSTSSAAPGATICYTTDGTIPTCPNGSNICGGPVGSNVLGGAAAGVNLPVNTSLTVNAITCATGLNRSSTSSATYALNVSPLVVSPDPGSFGAAVSATISQQVAPPELTLSGSICYSTNGSAVPASNPTCASDAMTGLTCVAANSVGLNFATTTTLRFRGCRAGFTSTSEMTAGYTINAYARTILIDGVNDFVDSENALATNTAGYTAYASWDASNIFVGLTGTGVGALNSTDYVHFYVLAGGAPNTTTTADNLGAGQFGNVALPTAVSHHVIWRTDNGQSVVRAWNGIQWVSSAGSVSANAGGVGATSFVELTITRASIGSPTNMTIAGGLTAGGTNVVTFPNTAAGGMWSKYLDANMSSFQNPNTAAYVKP